MRIKARDISEKDGSGSVRITAETPEDIWHVFNLLQVSDRVTSSTSRKVVKNSLGGAGGTERVRVTLSINVEAIKFDTDLAELRVSGKVVNENSHVQKGSYHTLELAAPAPYSTASSHAFTLEKDCWDSEALRRLKLASTPGAGADVLGVAMSTTQAVVCLVTEHMTVTRATFEPHIPRARGDGSGRNAAQDRFFGQLFDAVAAAAEGRLAQLKLIILAGPGFLKSAFQEYLLQRVTKEGLKEWAAAKSKIVAVDATGGHKRCLEDAMQDPAVVPLLVDTMAAGDVKALADFWTTIREDEDRAVYGPRHVAFAASCGSMDTLLICDALLRSSDPVERRFYVRMTDDVEANGGTVRVFSSLHASGSSLMEMTGVAGTLRAAMPDIDDLIDAEARASRRAAAAPGRDEMVAMAALVRGDDGEIMLRDGAESVTTTGSSEAGWDVEGEEAGGAAAASASAARG